VGGGVLLHALPYVCRASRAACATCSRQRQGRLKLELVSFSVDPDNDTPEVLAAYAKQYARDLATWRFLTGDLEVIRKTSEQGFKLALDGKATVAPSTSGCFTARRPICRRRRPSTMRAAW